MTYSRAVRSTSEWLIKQEAKIYYLTSADVDDESPGDRWYVYPSVEGGTFYLEDGVRRSLEELCENQRQEGGKVRRQRSHIRRSRIQHLDEEQFQGHLDQGQ